MWWINFLLEDYMHVLFRIVYRSDRENDRPKSQSASVARIKYIMFKSHASSHVDLHAAYGMFLNWKSKLLKIHQTRHTQTHTAKDFVYFRFTHFISANSGPLCCRHNWCVYVSYPIVSKTSLPACLPLPSITLQIHKQKSMRLWLIAKYHGKANQIAVCKMHNWQKWLAQCILHNRLKALAKTIPNRIPIAIT